MKTRYESIEFVQTTLVNKWNCINRKYKDELGSVFYYIAGKQYVFEPCEPGVSVFSSGGLRDIAHFLDQLNAEKQKENE